MVRKDEGFEGQLVLRIPTPVIASLCQRHALIGNLFPIEIGYYPKAKYHYFERPSGAHFHILIYCTDGSGWVKIKERKQTISKGEFIIIAAGAEHAYGSSEKNPWTIYWMHFSGRASGETIRMVENRSGKVDFYESRIKLFEEIYGNLEFGLAIENLCMASVCFGYFLASFIFPANYNLIANQQKKDVSNKSIQFMLENLDKMLSLDQIAKSVFLSSSHYSSIFRKKTGFSPIEYFNQLKVQKACQYLLLSEMQVQQIAYELGFEDPHYFTKMFIRIMGVSPLAYRKNALLHTGNSNRKQ